MEESKFDILRSWADNLIKRIQAEMKVQEIAPFNPYYKGENRLYESFDYDLDDLNHKIHNAAGGDIEKIIFFYEYYGLFVELGVQKGQTYNKERLSKPFHSGSKYAPKKEGIREPKPFLFSLVNQRVFSLQKITERVLTENITLAVMSSLSQKEKKERVKIARGSFMDRYLRAKGRI